MIIALKEERQKHHYSLQTMANKLGVSKTYYWQVEQGQRRLVYSLAVKIAKVLDCTTNDLFYDYFIEKLNLEGVESDVKDFKKNKKRKSNYNL